MIHDSVRPVFGGPPAVSNALAKTSAETWSDAEDKARGAKYIPGEVTAARENGQRVLFNTKCTNQGCWFWLFPGGMRIFHHSDRVGVGKCRNCGNAYLNGETIGPDGQEIS